MPFSFGLRGASATNRPNNTISYTSNFPSEPLVGNVPTSSAIVWTGVSVIMLLAGIGWLVWYYASRETESVSDHVPDDDPLIGAQISPSQKATVKYFLVVTLLFLLQIAMGMLTAHYGVEGGGFFGIPLADYLPYVVTRTWHTQLGIFWIATAWLAAGLFIAPFICGYEPKRQKLGVDVLFGALLIVVLGSMAGQWMSVMHMLYKWVVYFFVEVAFWNLVGAGIFGFMINPPIALYYMQGLNTTAVHAHGALYGVYGTLGLGLMLFCLRAMRPELKWKERPIWFAFWAINIGLMLEIVLSLLPVGLMQTYQSVSVGYWSARSSEFMQTELMQTLRWMRMIGDTIFALGAIAFVYFALNLMWQRPAKKPTIIPTNIPAAAEIV